MALLGGEEMGDASAGPDDFTTNFSSNLLGSMNLTGYNGDPELNRAPSSGRSNDLQVSALGVQ